LNLQSFLDQLDETIIKFCVLYTVKYIIVV